MSKPTQSAAARLEYLRGEIRAERISWGDLAELQSLAEHIDPGDVELLEWAGVPEHKEEEVDNEERASKANAAVMTHAELSGQAHDGVLDNADEEEAIGDLLCNLRHLADEYQLNWDRLLERADMHYSAEVDGDDEDEDACPNCGESFDDPPGSGMRGVCDIAEAHRDEHRDDKPGPVMTVGEHRQSADGPTVHGPFATYGEAREFAVKQYLSGEWDPHGYTFVYRYASPPCQEYSTAGRRA